MTYLLISLLFAMIYRILPDVEIPWRDVWFGALVTALLISLGKWAIGFYLGRTALASAYGTAASVIVILFWVYYALFWCCWARCSLAFSPSTSTSTGGVRPPAPGG